jgi:hypothetical protein
MSEEYCVGVKILLERMDTNPEEFIAPFNQIKGARWSNLMSGIIAHKLEKDVRGDINFLTEAEVDAVFEKYKTIRRKAFDDHILREVLGADEKLSPYKPKKIPTIQSITEDSLQILASVTSQAQLSEQAYAQRQALMAQQQDSYK